MSRVNGDSASESGTVERLLADAGSLFASSFDYEATLADVAGIAVRFLADFCIIDIVEGGAVRRVQVAHADPEKSELSSALLNFPLDRRLPHMSVQALDTQQPVLVPEVTSVMLEAISQGEEHRKILEELSPRSMMAIPLLARGNLIGVVLFVSSTSSYDEDDLTVAMRLVDLAALEVDNARLYGEARRALLGRDRVFGIVAHDLRNPLNTIMMTAEVMLDPSFPTSRRDAQVQMILRSAKRMNRLIQDLLDVARMEADQLYLNRETADPASVAHEAVELNTPIAEAASLSLRYIQGAKLPKISADQERLLQVLTNLIGNAVKFTPAGGLIEVSTATRDDEVLFIVSDTGPGISEEDMPRLFQPFWQSQRGSLDGAGLGLSIARGIVEAHGGRIWAESEVGRGSTFTFSLPADASAKPERRTNVADRRVPA